MPDGLRRAARTLWGARGVVLVGLMAVVTLCFAATGRLLYFVNPAYVVFTVAMAAIALGFCVGWVVLHLRGVEHDHPHAEDGLPRSPWRRAGIAVGGAVVVAIGAGLLVLPPAVLSSATAVQRDVTAAPPPSTSVTASETASAATFSHFTVRDWASLLSQTTDPSFYGGKTANVTGLVTPDPRGSSDVFYLARFVVTCCAVDAQPVAVPVYQPGWKDHFKADQWLDITGSFQADSSTSSDAAVVLVPAQVKKIDAPGDPYLY